jgi:hypothetical protein
MSVLLPQIVTASPDANMLTDYCGGLLRVILSWHEVERYKSRSEAVREFGGLEAQLAGPEKQASELIQW